MFPARLLSILLSIFTSVVDAESFRPAAQALMQASCLSCHAEAAEGGFDARKLGNDLTDSATFRGWLRVLDQIESGNMPPASEARPDARLVSRAMVPLRSALLATNEAEQHRNGRAILRRLTRTEYENAVNDLLGIQADLASLIPADNTAGLDMVYSSQGISPQHIRGYMDAADRAIDFAIRLDPPPEKKSARRVLYKEHPEIRKHIDTRAEGKVIIGETDNAIVMYSTAGYLFKFPGFHAEQPGNYRIRARASKHHGGLTNPIPARSASKGVPARSGSKERDEPVILTLNSGDYKRGTTEIIQAFDLVPGRTEEVEVTVFLNTGQYIFPGALNLQVQADGKGIWNVGAKDYTGAGVALEWVEVEGPLYDQWPPPSTRELLAGIEVRPFPHRQWDHARQRHFQFELVPGDRPADQLRAVVDRLAPRAFRRPLLAGEADAIVQMGTQLLDNGGRFDSAVRAVVRAVLTSPQFLFLSPKPGKLDDYELAARLALFLWRSVPDQTLIEHASKERLSDPKILRPLVDRMLTDVRSRRMVEDFARQWLRLCDIDATTPDTRLYPEFDELLKRAMLEETYGFLGHLIEADLSTDLLIDAPFTFLNRRLAEHYAIDGVIGQQMRKVILPPDSLRGGLLTQASILKVTANGTTTSPVRRGSWVLTHLLGQPPKPPPPSVGSIEPDTRGTTTIRELLDKHRSDSTCAACHQAIDPPGFALECFDVIGGFRTRFRSQGKGDAPLTKLHGRPIWEYKLGSHVDHAGTLANGQSFSDVEGYKQLLLAEREQIARHLISQLMVFATGAEIEFADRDDIEQIVASCRAKRFGVRSILHEIVQSSIFQLK